MSAERRSDAGERLAGAAGLALVALTAALSLWLARPPRPLPAAAAAHRFAAGRALVDVRELARQPRPPGSAGHRAARDYLLDRMAALELAPRVHETIVACERQGGIRAARVRNLVGRRAGRGGAGPVLLVAHYDSRPNTPGAGDDGAGVAVVLETVRALAQGPPLARDLIVLLSDAEELGLLGARGFAADHPWTAEVEVVLNFEARGSRGPAVIFETGRGDLDLVRAFARAAPQPMATSLSAAVYQRMPNDSDFTAFRARGASGLNFAFLGGLDAYHTALDTADRLDPASLQHAGANAVALIRHLDGWQAKPRVAGGDWFNPLGSWLLVLPAGAAILLAAILAALGLALAVFGVRRRRLDGRALGAAAALGLTVLMTLPLAGALLWKLFADNAGGLLDTPYELPHRLELCGVALLLGGLAAAAVPVALSRRARAAETGLGVALLMAVLALLGAALVPGTSFLFWWPLWGLLAAATVVVVVELPRPLAVLFVTAGALPGVALLAPLAEQIFLALTPRLAAAALAPAALIVVLALPALRAAAGERQGVALAALAACLAALAGSVWGVPDAERPRTVDLLHLDELDQGAGFWLSRDARPDPWIVERLGGAPQPWEAPPFLGLPEQPILKSPAVPATAAGPEAVTIEDSRRDGRRLTVWLRSPGGAPMLRVEAVSTVAISAVELAGQRFERDPDEAASPLRLQLAGLSPEGLEVTFQLPDRWPVELHLTEQFWGLPDTPPPPAGRIPDSSWLSHSRLVHRSFLR
jgi:hypothetical protein